MANRHLLARLARLERELRDRAPDYDAFMQAVQRSTRRTTQAFMSGTPSQPTERDLADDDLIERYLRAAGISLEADADRDRIKLLEFADYVQG